MDKLIAPMSAHPLAAVTAAGIVLFTIVLLRLHAKWLRRKRVKEMRDLAEKMRVASKATDPDERRMAGAFVRMIRRRRDDWGIPLHAAHTSEGELRRRLIMIEDGDGTMYPMPKLRYPDEEDAPDTLRSSGVPAACAERSLVSVVVPSSKTNVAGPDTDAPVEPDPPTVPTAVSHERPVRGAPENEDEDIPDTLPSAGQRRPAHDTELAQRIDQWIKDALLEDAG